MGVTTFPRAIAFGDGETTSGESTKSAFGISDILEVADHLPLKDKEALIDILRHRANEERRARMVREVGASDQEYRKGKSKVGTARQIMSEIVGSD